MLIKHFILSLGQGQGETTSAFWSICFDYYYVKRILIETSSYWEVFSLKWYLHSILSKRDTFQFVSIWLLNLYLGLPSSRKPVYWSFHLRTASERRGTVWPSIWCRPCSGDCRVCCGAWGTRRGPFVPSLPLTLGLLCHNCISMTIDLRLTF